MEFETWLAANDFDAATLTAKQKTTLEAQWRLSQRTAGADDPPDDKANVEPDVKAGTANFDTGAVFEPMKKERARQDAIGKLALDYARLNPTVSLEVFENIARTAIENSTDVRGAELEMLRASRGAPPASSFRREEQELTANVLEAAFAMQGGMPNIEKRYDARTLEVAKRNWRNGLSIVELIGFCAKRNGYRGQTSKGNMEAMLRASFNNQSQWDLRSGPSGPSTYSIPNIIANVANKYLDAGFLAIDNTWQSIASTRAVPDFKQTSTNALSSSLIYRALPPGGEIKHGTISETNYVNQANTYATMVGIDRRDLINDDSGALAQISTHMGRGGALKINDIFWTVFLNNTGSFFTSGNANVSTGGGSALATADGAAINAAEVKFMNQTGPDSLPLGVMPKIMLVPPTLRNTAARWMGSQLFIGSTGLGDSNIYGGRYTVVSSPYMESAAYTGNSTAAWYLLANPADLSTIEGVFVNGQQTPTVETSDMDWNTLGLSFRGYIDFGFALKEYRAGVRSAGS